MTKSTQNQIDENTTKLMSYIESFDKNIFIPTFIFLLWADRTTNNNFLQLSSKVQQVLYILRLFLNEKNGNRKDIDFQRVQSLTETIETLYKEKFADGQIEEYYDHHYRKSLAISGTYLNYFLNSSLVYIEQIVSRIKGTFGRLSDYIIEQTELSIDDYLDFYLETVKISSKKFQGCHETFISQHVDKNEIGTTCYSKDNALFLPFSLPHELALSQADYEMEVNKLERLFSYFSCCPGDNGNSFYCSPNILWSKPFISLAQKKYYLAFYPQLIISIYYFLYDICDKKDKQIASRARSAYLEQKTKQLFENYLTQYKPKIYVNYYLNYGNNEKDLLIISRDTAIIIECKSKKYNEPLGNTELSFERIKKDFKVSIQDAYRQVNEVEEAITSIDILTITDKKRHPVEVIQTKKLNHVYSIIVTQERFGQIQCDLGLLLNKKDEDPYPWSVSIDDLESILLTFSRKQNPYGELLNYLQNREKLHERLICFDELDLAGYFLMQKKDFIKACNSENIFISSSDVCQLFDDLYQNGFGFEDEYFLPEKLKISVPALLTYELCKKLKLKTPQNIYEYKCQNGISDNALRSFKKLFTTSRDNPEVKELFDKIKYKSISYKDFHPLE